jgi:DNA polymerase III epsilon subunit-like protein
MNAGVLVFITQLTGITNAMVTSAPDAEQVIAGRQPLCRRSAAGGAQCCV